MHQVKFLALQVITHIPEEVLEPSLVAPLIVVWRFPKVIYIPLLLSLVEMGFLAIMHRKLIFASVKVQNDGFYGLGLVNTLPYEPLVHA